MYHVKGVPTKIEPPWRLPIADFQGGEWLQNDRPTSGFQRTAEGAGGDWMKTTTVFEVVLLMSFLDGF